MNNKLNLIDFFKESGFHYSSRVDLRGLFVTQLVRLDDSVKGGIAFIDKNRSDKEILLQNSVADVILCDSTLINHKKRLIHVEDPKLIFTLLGNQLLSKRLVHYISESARIHPEAKIEEPVYIGENVNIGKCQISAGTVIRAGAKLLDNTRVGKCVIIYSGAIIGETGFGYIRNQNERLEQFPHVGGVIIEDFVEIGANSCIDRGSLGNTVIGHMSKIDNLVHIGHNVQIGRAVMIAARTSVAGSSIIGNYSNIWTSVSIANNIEIGESCEIGMGSIVISNVPDQKKCFGNPARIYA